MNTKEVDLSDLKQKWPSTIVARDQIEAFSGGLLSRGSMANLDCRGQGPPRFSMGPRKVAYPVDTLVSWMEQRIQRCRKPRAVKPRKDTGQFAKTGGVIR